MTLATDTGPEVQTIDQAPLAGNTSTDGDGGTAGASGSGAFGDRVVAGRYRLIEPLGRGGMGRVYRSHDDLLDRPVAVKLIYDDAVSVRDQRRACAVEARAAARLSHPGVVRILDSGFDDGHCFVVMELAEGQTLAQILRERGALSIERALGLAAQVADALEEAHRQGVVHCDVKPGNLIVDSLGRIRLVDFGIARVTSSSSGLSDSDMHGSAKYVAPEQVEGAAIDGRTDLYALGVVLFEMLAGRPPFTGGSLASVLAQRLVADPPSVRTLRPAVSADVDSVVCRAMAREPDDRYQTAGDLRDALKAAREALQATDRFSVRETAPAAARRVAGPSRIELLTSPLLENIGPWLTQLVGHFRDRATTLGERVSTVGARVTSLREQVSTPMPLQAPAFPTRWPSLPAAVGILALVGLLTGMAAAQCGTAGMATDDTLAAQPADPPVQALVAPAATAPATTAPAPPPPAVVPTTAPTLAPAVAPTDPPPPTSPPAEPAPTSAPTAAVAPAQTAPAPRPQVQAIVAPAPEPDAAADTDEADPPAALDETKPRVKTTSNHPDDKTLDTLPAVTHADIPPPAPQAAAPQPAPKPQSPPPPAPKPESQPAAKPQGGPPGQVKKTEPAPAPAHQQQSSGGNNQGGGNGRGRGR